MVAFLEREGIEGARVLELGGGVGEIHLELLKRARRTAVNLELSPAYDPEATAPSPSRLSVCGCVSAWRRP